jgi:hypothetical protein
MVRSIGTLVLPPPFASSSLLSPKTNRDAVAAAVETRLDTNSTIDVKKYYIANIPNLTHMTHGA